MKVKPEDSNPDWTGVHAALEEFYQTLPKRDDMARAVRSSEDVAVWQKAVEDARLKVCEAFYGATNDRNSHDNCMLCHPWDIARMSRYPVPGQYIPTGERLPV